MTDHATPNTLPRRHRGDLLAPHATGPALVDVDGDVARPRDAARRGRSAGGAAAQRRPRPQRPDRDRAAQRPGDGVGAAGGDVGRLRGAAQPEVPRGRVPLLPRRPRRRSADHDRRARAPAAHAAAPGPARSRSTSAATGLSIELVAPPADETPGCIGRPTRTPTTRRWCCTRPARRRGPRSCRCASATSPARRATSPRRSQLTADDRSLDGDAAVPHPRDHGRAAGAAVGRRRRWSCTPGFDAFKFHRWVDELQPTYYTRGADDAPDGARPRAGDRDRRRCDSCARRRRRCRAPVLDELRELFDVPVIEAYGMTEASHQMTCNPLPPAVDQAGLGRASRPASRSAILDAHEQRAAARRARRGVDQGRHDRRRLREQPDRQRGRVHRRMVPHRRRGHARRRRLPVPHRPPEGADQPRRREDLTARDRRGAAATPGGRRGGARSRSRTTSSARRSARAVVLVDGHELTERELRTYLGEQLAAFKVPRRDRVRRRDPQGRDRQDPAHRTRRPPRISDDLAMPVGHSPSALPSTPIPAISTSIGPPAASASPRSTCRRRSRRPASSVMSREMRLTSWRGEKIMSLTG